MKVNPSEEKRKSAMTYNITNSPTQKSTLYRRGSTLQAQVVGAALIAVDGCEDSVVDQE